MFGRLELPTIHHIHDVVLKLEQIHPDFDDGTEASEPEDPGHQSFSAHEVHWVHFVEDKIDHRGIQELGNHVLEDQRTHSGCLGLVLLHLSQVLESHAQQDVYHVCDGHHQEIEQNTYELLV
jgi:hypothetical protein